jgi:hypothetical protein
MILGYGVDSTSMLEPLRSIADSRRLGECRGLRYLCIIAHSAMLLGYSDVDVRIRNCNYT